MPSFKPENGVTHKLYMSTIRSIQNKLRPITGYQFNVCYVDENLRELCTADHRDLEVKSLDFRSKDSGNGSPLVSSGH